jgi:hypothetical protein
MRSERGHLSVLGHGQAAFDLDHRERVPCDGLARALGVLFLERLLRRAISRE